MMSNDLNQCQFIGRLGNAPDTRYLPSGDAVCNFSIAVGSQWKNKAGEKQESTEWVNITAFGKLGEICGQYLVKGSQIYISGKLKTEKYQDKETGKDRYSTKVIADTMQMIGGKREESEQQSAPVQQAKTQSSANDFTDDIPFAPFGKNGADVSWRIL